MLRANRHLSISAARPSQAPRPHAAAWRAIPRSFEERRK
jgi:hypothetical protein